MEDRPSDSAPKKEPKSFEALTPELSAWVLDYARSMNFARTTPVQAMAIPLLMGNKDLVVEVSRRHHLCLGSILYAFADCSNKAVTGSGKTLSFLIPLVERLLKSQEPNKKAHVRSIVIAPTKELATQIYQVLQELLAFHDPSAARLKPPTLDEDGMDIVTEECKVSGPAVIPQLLIGGRAKLHEDLATFSRIGPNVLVGTPKRTLEVLQSSKVILKRHWYDLLVLDEADRLLDSNFRQDLQKLLDLVPKERRTGLFSASVSEAVNELIRVGMRYPFKISAKVRSKTGALDKRTPESLKLAYLVVKPSRKLACLKKILQERDADKTIVYVSTRAGVDYWHHILPAVLGTTVFTLHGDQKADLRAKNLRKFRDCTLSAILLTTDVLARGIDIPDIDLVVQLDPPTQPKDFIHRCGRSGRAGRRGMALAFLNEGSEEDYIRYLNVQGTTVEPYPASPMISEEDGLDGLKQIREILQTKRELHDRSQKAFVSWVQAYTKSLPSDIFSVRSLDWAETGRAWGLLRWPKMPELKRYYPQAVANRSYELDLPADFDLGNLRYADAMREETRQAVMAARARGERPALSKSNGGKLADLQRRKDRAWSSQKEAKSLRDTRRERKHVRRRAERIEKMDDAEKKKDAELNELIARVRQQNEASVDDDSFQGFGD